MAIIVDRDTKLVVQGLTGSEGSFHARRNKEYGTNLVAGVTPGKGSLQARAEPIMKGRRSSTPSARRSGRPVPTRRWSSCRLGSPPMPLSRRTTPASTPSS
jgi:hypothetical protein